MTEINLFRHYPWAKRKMGKPLSLDPANREGAQRECLKETGFFCTDLKSLVSFRPGLDNVENLNTVFYSESVEERRPFVPDPAEALAIAWVPIEDSVTLVLEQKIIDCLTLSTVLAYRCRGGGR